jgi:hypothetical protein
VIRRLVSQERHQSSDHDEGWAGMVTGAGRRCGSGRHR